MKMKHFTRLLSLFFILITSLSLAKSTIVSHDERAITINGKRRILLSGSIHYPRSTADVTINDLTHHFHMFFSSIFMF